MTNWNTYKLGEISTDISYGYTESAKQEKIGPKFLRITDIQTDLVEWETVPYCKITPKDFEKYRLEIGDIVIARTGNSTGATSTIKDNVEAVYASYLIRYRLDQEIANPFYVDYILRSNKWKLFVDSIKGGSAQPGANAKQLAEFEFNLPNLPTQRRIAEILSALDDKIELNRRMNHTLEQMAQTLYRQYFVDGIDEENLPEGWREGKLGDIVNVKGGTTPSTKQREFWDGNINWTSPKDLSSARFPVLLDTEKKVTEAGLKKISSGLLPVGTLLLSSRAPIGYLAITQIPVAINQGYIAILCEKGYSNYFMLYWLKENMSTVIQNANGSTFLEISKSVFKSIDLSIPPVELVKEFDAKVDALFQKLVLNEKESIKLTQLRDTLLSKLMSGEIDVMQIKPEEQHEPVLS